MQKYHLFTPGPTMVPGDVALAGAKDMIHHRTDQFTAIYKKCATQLKELFYTQRPVLVLLSSGTGAMEAAVDSVVAAGEKMITFNGGVKGKGVFDTLDFFIGIIFTGIPVFFVKGKIGLLFIKTHIKGFGCDKLIVIQRIGKIIFCVFRGLAFNGDHSVLFK